MSYTQWPAVTAIADNNGNAIAPLPQLRTGQKWLIGQVAISTNSSNTTTADILLNGGLVTHSESGNVDTADGDPPIPVTSTDAFVVQWSGCKAGDICTAYFYYEDTASQNKILRSNSIDDKWQWQ